MKSEIELEIFIRGLQLRHFTPSEIMFPGSQNQELQPNTIPPDEIWKNIVPTIWIADLARHALNVPLRIISAYRSKDYNSSIGGAQYSDSYSDSEHLNFRAVDLACEHPYVLFQYLLGLRNARLFHGGLGIYPTFVHLDTRGVNATW